MPHLIFTLLLFFASLTQAENTSSQAVTYQIGLGTGVYIVDPKGAYSRSQNSAYQSWLINSQFVFNDYLAVKADIYRLKKNGDALAVGQELALMIGLGIKQKHSSRWYLLPGYFHESRSDFKAANDQKANFSGWSFGIGAGYQWDTWSVDFNLVTRQNRDYVDYYQDKYLELKNRDVSATTSQFIISYAL